MRQLLHGDVTAAARVLLRLPPEQRAGALAEMIAAADLAHRWRKRTGRALPGRGDGSLAAAAAFHDPAPEPFLSDPDHLECLRLVIEGLIARRAHRPARP